VTPGELLPPGDPDPGLFKVWGTSSGRRGWAKLARSHPSPLRDCYHDLAHAPFPPRPTPRHHRLKGRLREFWEWEVGGGERVRYKKHFDGNPVVVYAGPSPPDTH
jgi:hypothetical protein